MLLARYLTSLARDDFSYARPSRREGDYILPALRSTQLDLVVALDISGSIRDDEIAEFVRLLESNEHGMSQTIRDIYTVLLFTGDADAKRRSGQ